MREVQALGQRGPHRARLDAVLHLDVDEPLLGAGGEHPVASRAGGEARLRQGACGHA
jgi:hypothetical protein